MWRLKLLHSLDDTTIIVAKDLRNSTSTAYFGGQGIREKPNIVIRKNNFEVL